MKGRKLLALAMALVLTLPLMGAPAAAVTFTDIDHWAKPYIEDMAERGMVKGYEDNTYRPDNQLSVAEGLAFCARSLEMSGEVSAAVLSKHAAYLNGLLGGELSWFRTELALCLESGILSRNELETLVKQKALETGAVMSKQDLARYLVRAMGLDLLAESQQNYPLSFSDKEEITEENLPSVYLMNIYGLVTGDEKNIFDAPVTRGIMATMLSRVLAFKAERGIVSELADFTGYAWTAGAVRSVVTGDAGEVTLALDNGFGAAGKTVALSADAVIYENNMETTVKSLKEGKFVRAALNDRGEVVSLRVYGTMQKQEGVLSDFDRGQVLFVRNGKTVTAAMDRFTLVEADGVVSGPEKLDLNKEYTSVAILVDGRGKAAAVSFRGASSEKSGLYGGGETLDGAETLTLLGYDGSAGTYVLDQNAVITVDGVVSDEAVLRNCDLEAVKIHLSDETGLVTGVDVDTGMEYVQGRVHSAVWKAVPPEITVTDANSDWMKTCPVPMERVTVFYRGEAIRYEDIESGWFATVRLEEGKAVEVWCFPAVVTVEGRLTDIDYSALPAVIMTVESGDGEVNRVKVDTKNLPRMERDGESVGVEKFRNGDRISATFKYNELIRIEGQIQSDNFVGTIQSVFRTLAGDKVSVLLEDGRVVTYTLAVDVSVEKKGWKVDVSELRAGYRVSMAAEGDRLTVIRIEETDGAMLELAGKVLFVNLGERTVLFELEKTGEWVNVHIPGSGVVNRLTGEPVLLSELKAGDTMTIFGNSDGEAFEADSILR